MGVLLQERENIANAGSALLRRQEKVLRELKTQNRILHQFVTRVEVRMIFLLPLSVSTVCIN